MLLSSMDLAKSLLSIVRAAFRWHCSKSLISNCVLYHLKVCVQKRGHLLITGVLGAMGKVPQAVEGAIEFWLLKALTQLIDLRIHHAADAAAAMAEQLLMSGKATL